MIASTAAIAGGVSGRAGTKHRPTRVGAFAGQLEVDAGPQERVGNLDQDARAVARVGLGALRAAMIQIAQRAEGGVDDVAAGSTLDVDDERHAAGVVLEARIVQAIRSGRQLNGSREVVWSERGLAIVILHPVAQELFRGAEGRRWPGRG